MWGAWDRVIAVADPYLDSLGSADLEFPLPHDGRENAPAAGSQLQRITYHYWSHIGEASAIRQIPPHPAGPVRRRHRGSGAYRRQTD